MLTFSLRRALKASLATLMIWLLAACGGGGGGAEPTAPSTPTPAADTGTVTVAVTDAEGDFLSYTVDVLRIELRRSSPNGNVSIVQALPATTRVDFAELSSLSEILNSATVPAGSYDEVRLLLDYSNAAIVVQDANGNAVNAPVRDSNGAALAQLDVTLKLAERDHIVVSRGVASAFTIDFDLAASNTVAFDPVTVTVAPLLVATAQLASDRTLRVRGLLDAVDQANSLVTLVVRPHGSASGRFGANTFGVADTTAYEINGTASTGSAGLTALAALADDTLVVASGSISDRRLQASRVLAGTSVPGAGLDVVHGVVVARSGNVLTVRGARSERGSERRFMRGAVSVTLGSATQVESRLGGAGLTESAISVGALVSAFGALTTDGDSAALDASNGRVVLQVNEVAGRVVATAPLTIDLDYLNGLRPALFNFAGTGTTAATDADVNAYEVDTTGLSLAGLETGGLVRVRGLPTAFASAAPDFAAVSLIDVQSERSGAAYVGSWRSVGGSATPFTAISATGITLDLSDGNSELHLRGVQRHGNDALVAGIVPSANGNGVFAIHVRGAGDLTLYRTFAAFTDALQRQLDGTRLLRRLSATGHYNAVDGILTAERMTAELVSR